MSSTLPRPLLEVHYYQAAQAYLASLPFERFMETRPEATQREISVQSFALLKLRRPDVHYFNELLVQYPHGRTAETRQVVPDNMIVVYDGPIRAEGSYDVELQPAAPLLVLEYVSKSSRRKDYEESFRKYERELKVPYYLLFYPETQDLTLFRRNTRRYVSVKPNDAERLAIPELKLEVAIHDGWARYWYRGEMLPLSPDLQRTVDKMVEELRATKEKLRRAEEQTHQTQEREQRLLAQLRALGIEPDL
jgi:Uma2 family endonuclease